MKRIRAIRVVSLGVVLLSALGATACHKFGNPLAAVKRSTSETSGSSGGRVTRSAISPRPALPAGWQEFKHPEGAYRIYLPGPPHRPRNTASSLEPNRPMLAMESRESIHEVTPTATQRLGCSLQLIRFHPSGRAAFDRFDAKPRIIPNGWTVTADRPVLWAGRQATEMIIEKTFPTDPPRRSFSVGRYILGPDSMYQFAIEREDHMPTAAEQAAFFDSFVPGH